MRTFLRLLGFLRPYRAGTLWALVLASFAMVGTAALPWLTGRAIDQIQQGDRGALRLLCGAIVAAALGRLVLSVARRLVAGRVSLGVEVDMRDRLYGHLLALDMGFFDNQQTGQLMSRATVDLSSVRFFLGYGLVFITQSALTILLAAAAMIALEPRLGLLALIPVPFVVATRFWSNTRWALRRKRASWRSSRAKALTTRTPDTFSSASAVSSAMRCWTSCRAGREIRP